jgi:formylmethanofuran dehydrogenase subunit E
MTKITTEIREQYKALRAKADEAYDAAEPQRQALKDAEKPWLDIEEQIDILTDGFDIEVCEGCGEPIFEGDKTHSTGDGQLCAGCSPTYAEMLAEHGMFTLNDEPMTAEQAKAICDAHVAAGGSLDDSMAR